MKEGKYVTVCYFSYKLIMGILHNWLISFDENCTISEK